MCGFLACFSAASEPLPDKSLLLEALDLQNYRGPDFTDYTHNSSSFLGHNRLSIQDLSSYSSQPFSKHKNFSLIFNGEIYNFRELADTYLSAESIENHSSDTEVLYELLVLFGISKTLGLLRGMFSFVFTDFSANQSYLARDHFGQKPLFYSYQSTIFAASSSIKSLIHCLQIQPRIAPNTLETYLDTRGLIQHNKTFIEGIHVLPAGHYLSLNIADNDFTIQTFFKPEDLIESGSISADLSHSDDDLLPLFSSVVNEHLASDARVGVLLSGGIDSSLVYTFAKNFKKNISVFTKNHKSIENYPDLYVRTQVRDCDTLHFSEIPITEYFQNLINYIDFGGRPAPWGGAPPLMNLCQLAASKNIKVLVGGDGIDEYTCGYEASLQHFAAAKSLFDIDPICKTSPLSQESTYFQYHLEIRKQIVNNLCITKPSPENIYLVNSLHNLLFFLQACNLPHSDTLSMRHSVELRNPMLDLRLVRYILNRPLSSNISHWDGSTLSGKFSLKLLAQSTYASKFSNDYFIKKEGTRNYSKLFSAYDLWDWSKFHLSSLLDINSSCLLADWRYRFSIINAEIFYRLTVFKEPPCQEQLSVLLSDTGLSTLLYGQP